MDLNISSIVDKEAINTLNNNGLISFVSKEVGFDKFCTISTKGLGVKKGVEQFLKTKPFWKKPEFVIPTLIAIIAIVVQFITGHLDSKELEEHTNKQEIISISDSISKALLYQQDSLLQITNSLIGFLSTSYNSNLDFKK